MEQDLALTRKVIMDALAPYRVRIYLFGSMARGDGRRASDIDVAVQPLEALPAGTLSELRERLEEANILRRVELVDLGEAAPAFRDRVLREGTMWR